MTDTPTPIRRRGPRRRTSSRKAASNPGGITGNLRSQLAEQVKPCPHCGSPGGNKTRMAQEIGISVMSLNKFLKGGRVNSDTIDAVHAYVNKPQGK